jgi:hypothetical protein
MARYGKSKYGISKYGKYELEVPSGIDLSQLTKYRIRSVSSDNVLSRPIVNSSVQFGIGGPVKVRLKTNTGDWVYQQMETISGDMLKIRIKAVGNTESPWVESIVGTLKNKQV